jgi:hypothetical protein
LSSGGGEADQFRSTVIGVGLALKISYGLSRQ